MAEDQTPHDLTVAWLRSGLRRRDLLRLLGAGVSATTIGAILSACGGSPAPTATTAATAASSAATTAPRCHLPHQPVRLLARRPPRPPAPPLPTAAQRPAPPRAPQPLAARWPLPFVTGTVATDVTLTLPIVTTVDITLDPAQGDQRADLRQPLRIHLRWPDTLRQRCPCQPGPRREVGQIAGWPRLHLPSARRHQVRQRSRRSRRTTSSTHGSARSTRNPPRPRSTSSKTSRATTSIAWAKRPN